MSTKLFDYPYPQNLIASITGGYDTIPPLPHDIDRAITYVLDSLYDPKWADILLKHFKEYQSTSEIAALYGITPSLVRRIILAALRKLRHPARFVFLKYGYSGAIQHLTPQERLCFEQDVAYEKALVTFQCDAAGVPLHSIQDEQLRVTTILSRSKFQKTWETKLPRRIGNLLYRAGYTHLWQVCFLTPEQVLTLPNVGPKSLADIQTVLDDLNLALDDGMLSGNPELLAYAKYRFELFEEAATVYSNVPKQRETQLIQEGSNNE